MLKSLLYRLTGGRPMLKIKHAFTDIVDGREVYYFLDRRGTSDNYWLANSAWSRYRVPAKKGPMHKLSLH